MNSDHSSDEVVLAQEMKRIISSLRDTGPKDLYQLQEEGSRPDKVEVAVQTLVSQNLIIERVDFPSTPDPFTKVYSLPIPGKTSPTKPTASGKLPSW